MKKEILLNATEMFLTLGFKSVTMDDIAAKMGISKKTIYQHFNSKPDLVENVTLHLYDTISNGINEINKENDNAIAELYKIKDFISLQLKNEKSSPSYQLQKYYPKIHSTIRKKHLEKMDNFVIDNLKKGINQGLYRNEINIDIICRIYFIGMTGIKNEELFPSNIFNIKKIEEQLLEYHLRGICTIKGLNILEEIIKTQS
jgi:TetR/AcrR family transcriptional regulator, cholesterol catabolism regulator